MAKGGKRGRRGKPQARRAPLAPQRARTEISRIRKLELALAASEAALRAARSEATEALERQKATAEILKVIASSPSDIQPVLDAVAERAARLCDATDALIRRVDGDGLRMSAHFGQVPANIDVHKITRGSVGGRAVVERRTIHVHDITASESKEDFPDAPALRFNSGYRTMLAVPLVHGREAVGVILIRRPDVRPFTDKQIKLLETFADQAVIAIENVRLFNQTREALERQTAISEILRVISDSPGDVMPVMSAVAERAARICEAAVVDIVIREGDAVRVAATYGELGRPLGMLVPLNRETVMGRSIVDARPIQFDDLQSAPDEYKLGRELAIKYGHRSILGVPLMREGKALGTILVRRAEVKPFEERHVALLQTFAGQAAIAIENVRLFNETREALDRQTATGEILASISSSMADAQPVFDAIARAVVRLLGTPFTAVQLVHDGQLHLASFMGPGFEELREYFPQPLTAETAATIALKARRVVQVVPIIGNPQAPERSQRLAEKFGYNGIITVPLMREGKVVGAIAASRREAVPFDDKQTALLQSFADQAVIAIENSRLFNETKEALEQQKASAEVLGVISNSVADATPVFEKIAESCQRLFGGRLRAGVNLVRDGMIHYGAIRAPEEVDRFRAAFPMPLEGTAVARAFEARTVIQFPDIFGGADVPESLRRASDRTGARSTAIAPMLWEGRGIGIVFVARESVGEYSAKEISLLKTFADQAVIAIQNARLFNETKEALERQTATAEILKVIASSPSDVQPVFDAIAMSAMRLLGGLSGSVTRAEGDMVHLIATTAKSPAAVAAMKNYYPRPLSLTATTARVLRTGKPEFRSDYETDPEAQPDSKALARERGFRSSLWVPLLRNGVAFGTIQVARAEAGPFSDHQIKLLETFASQAVIAIENVRLFNETKEALERQTATSEVLRVIGRSVTDIQPVFDIIAERAARLTGAEYGWVFRFDGEQIHVASAVGVNAEGMEAARRAFPMRPGGGSVTARAVRDGKVVNVADVLAEDDAEYRTKEVAKRAGYRATLSVPMIRDRQIVGAITASRAAVGKFSDKEVDLLGTFADQAVIAIENVRLFNETKEALEQQTATAEILKVISESPTDTQPVFDAIVQSGLRLFPGATVAVAVPAGGKVRMAAVASKDASREAAWRARFPVKLARDRLHGAAILDGVLVDIPDVAAEVEGPFAAGAKNFLESGNRAVTIMPMMCADAAIGTVSVVRQAPGPLTEKQLALLRTFAAQAVIAIENVRVFKELEARTGALTRSVEQLTALSEVGRAISSTLDLQTVLKTIVQRAVQLTGLDSGSIYEYDEKSEEFHLRAAENLSEEVVRVLRETPARRSEGVIGRAVETGEPVEIAEMLDDTYQSPRRDTLIESGMRALLVVPLRRDEHIIGALAVSRKMPGHFSHDVVELLKTFATQSAMAIQNARLFREIEQKGRELEVASQHKSQFLASMSHELRTPLNAILGFNEMILDQVYGELSEDLRAPLENIQSSGKHLLRLINNVLDLAKIEAGRMELALADFVVQDTVAGVHATLKPLAEQKGLALEVTVPADLPLAYGDPGRISQCLINLAGNSLKFTKQGRVALSVALRDGATLLYTVADTGIGIPPDKIGSLFTEFKQTDATIASEYGGTGLGLSITKKFIEMHGGRIWVESEPGRGSTFLFEVPLRVAQ